MTPFQTGGLGKEKLRWSSAVALVNHRAATKYLIDDLTRKAGRQLDSTSFGEDGRWPPPDLVIRSDLGFRTTTTARALP